MKRFFTLAVILASSAMAQDANKMPEHIQLKTETVNAVLQYLGQKPYAESAQLIARIQQESSDYIKKVNAPKDTKEEKPAKK